MSETATTEGAPAAHRVGRVSIPLTIGAALVSGIGLFGTFYWLYTFNWLYFPSVLAVALGCYLLFTRITGPDHA